MDHVRVPGIPGWIHLWSIVTQPHFEGFFGSPCSDCRQPRLFRRNAQKAAGVLFFFWWPSGGTVTDVVGPENAFM